MRTESHLILDGTIYLHGRCEEIYQLKTSENTSSYLEYEYLREGTSEGVSGLYGDMPFFNIFINEPEEWTKGLHIKFAYDT